jgi:hypothetical protein
VIEDGKTLLRAALPEVNPFEEFSGSLPHSATWTRSMRGFVRCATRRSVRPPKRESGSDLNGVSVC